MPFFLCLLPDDTIACHGDCPQATGNLPHRYEVQILINMHKASLCYQRFQSIILDELGITRYGTSQWPIDTIRFNLMAC